MDGAGLRLIQVTDTHVTPAPGVVFHDLDPVANLARVLAHARAGDWPPHAVLATGDLADDGSEAAYRRLKPLLADLAVPVFLIPGNHDDPAAMRRLLAGGAVRAESMWSAGGWRLLFLDTTIPGVDQGRLGPERLAALDSALGNRSTHPVLVVLHHNPVPTGSGADPWPLEDRAELFGVLDRHTHVRGLVWGHIHCAFDAERRGVRLMGTPSSCYQFPTVPGTVAYMEQAPGYRRIALNPDGTIGTQVVWLPA